MNKSDDSPIAPELPPDATSYGQLYRDLKGRALGSLLSVAGKRVLGKELAKTVKAIEAGNEAPPPATP